ncbi:helix-turn-helix domain-containing protein [Methylopila sp. M107]|uniref:AraC-like ligand-binding domain-containing protein n=1 Tax=Methylopila sp. M107 TaxID=1101190 RepID=UPI00037DD5F8|nr:helix-turn-helix domain-containing protein [Methylopila sp. M107]
MDTLFTTASLHARDRFEYWHEVAERVLTGHDSRPARRDRFDAELRAANLADLGLFSFEMGAMACERAGKHIAHGATDDLFLCRNGSGRFALEQNGRRNLFRSGDMVLLDANRRYSVQFSSNSQMIMLKIPRRILEARFGEMHDVFGAKLAGATGLNAHLAATLDSICSNVCDFDQATADTVRNHLVDLLAHTFNLMLGEGRRLTTPRALALMRLKHVVEARIADPNFDGAAAARAAGMSVRYANALLGAQDTSLARFIRAARLDRCRQALADPAQDHRAIGEIVFAWGFQDISHFGRLFSATYGVTPRAYRRSRGEDAEPLAAPAPDTLSVA